MAAHPEELARAVRAVAEKDADPTDARTTRHLEKSDGELRAAFNRLKRIAKTGHGEWGKRLVARGERIQRLSAFRLATSSSQRRAILAELSVSWEYSGSTLIIWVAGVPREIRGMVPKPDTPSLRQPEAPDGLAHSRTDMTYEEADAYAEEAIAWHEAAEAESEAIYSEVLSYEPYAESCPTSGPSESERGPCADAFQDAINGVLGAAAYIGLNKETVQAALNTARSSWNYYSAALTAGTISTGLFLDAVVGIVTTLVGSVNLGWIASAAAIAGAGFLAYHLYECLAPYMYAPELLLELEEAGEPANLVMYRMR